MPLGKYYCDYCDKQFQDTPFARKRHIQGIQHQRARSKYYDSVNSYSNNPNSPQLHGVCHRFLRTGFCQFGDGCKYQHPTQNFRAPMIVGSTNQGNVMLGNGPNSPISPMITQAPNVFGNQISGCPAVPGTINMVKSHSGLSWNNLPPSLRPPPDGGYPSLPFVDWGW